MPASPSPAFMVDSGLSPPPPSLPGQRGSGNITCTPAPARLPLWSEAEKRSCVQLHSPGAADVGPWAESGQKRCFLCPAQRFYIPNIPASRLGLHTPGLFFFGPALTSSIPSPAALPSSLHIPTVNLTSLECQQLSFSLTLM